MINIALNTFREIIRNRFLYIILFFAFLFILFSIALGKLTIGEGDKVVVDFGLAMIEIFWILGIVFIGSQLLFNEVEGKTIFLILSKPIKRYEFILGKFFGFSGVIVVIIVLQALIFLAVLLVKGIPISELILATIFFTLLKLEILLSIVLFFSSFMSNIMTILSAIMVYIIAHSFSLLLDIAHRAKNVFLEYIVQSFQLLFPPLEYLNIKDVIGSFTQFHPNYFIANTFYSVVYIALLLFFTVLIFNRKTFEN